MDQTVEFASGQAPSWPTVQGLLAGRGFPVQMRMIEGELAFPDETPPDHWRELRLGTPAGMVTVRRDGDRLVFVIWGNAEPALLQAWNGLVWAFAEAGQGTVQGKSAAGYRRAADLPAVLRDSG